MRKEDLILIFFDLETTGLNPDTDEVIEIGAIKVKNGKVVEHFHSFVRPHRNIPSLVTNLTGITYKDVEDAPDPSETRKKFEEFIRNYPLIAHNVSFDRIFLEKFMGKRLDNEFFDTLELARIFFPDLPSHSLQNLVKTLSLKKEEAHRALSDTLMLYSLFNKISDEKDKSSPFLLHRIKDISQSVRNFENIFGEEWEKPEEKEESFVWEMKDADIPAQTLPFGAMNYESPVERYISDGITYIEGYREEKLIESVLNFAASRKTIVSLYENSLRNKILDNARKRGVKVFCLNSFNRFICPKKIEYLVSHPELITDNLKMNFATLFSYLYKTRDFLLKNAPTHILRNPLLRLLSFCDTNEGCEYEDVCPLKEALKRTKQADLVITNHAFFFNALNNNFDISERSLLFLNSYRLIKAFFSAKTGFSLNDFLFFARYYGISEEDTERIKEVFRELDNRSIGEDAKWAANEMRMIFSNFRNPLLDGFFTKEYFWMERRGDNPVIFGADKRAKSVFSKIRNRVKNVLFFTPILSTDDSENVLKDFTGIDGKEIFGEEPPFKGEYVSVIPLFMHSPNRDEFTEEFVSFFKKVHIKGRKSVMMFSSTETMKKIYFLLKRNGVDVKARGIDLKSEHGEVDLLLYDTSFYGGYEEIYFVRLPVIVPSFYGKNRSQVTLYSMYVMKNIAAELLQKIEVAEVYYFDGRFKTPSFRARFGNDFVSFPLFIDREQALTMMLSNWRKRHL